MKKIYTLFIAILITVAAWSQTTYTWQGEDNGSWVIPTNWNPARITPAASDILQFNDGTIKTVTDVPTQTIGKIAVTAITSITLQASTATTLTIAGNSRADLIINAGSELTMGANVNVTLATNNDVTAIITGTLIVTSGCTYDSDNDQNVTTVTGTIENSGTVNGASSRLLFPGEGIYIHAQNGGTIPKADWNNHSVCIVQDITTALPTGLNQFFGNFIWDCANQTGNLSFAGNLTTIAGTLTIANTGTGDIRLKNSGGTTSTTIKGDYVQTGGTFIIVGSANTHTVNLNGNFNMSGGILSRLGGTANFVFNKTGVQTFTKTGGTISGIIDFRIDNGSIVNFGTSMLDASAATFTLDADGKIITGKSSLFTRNLGKHKEQEQQGGLIFK